MEHISNTRRGGEPTTGAIPIHNIRVGEGNDVGSGNGADDADNSIISSYSSSYWGQTTNQTKEETLQRRVVCVNSKCGPEGSRGGYSNHANATKAL